MRLRLRTAAVAVGVSTLVATAAIVLTVNAQAAITLSNSALVSPASGRCMDVGGNAATNGAVVDVWDCTFAADQLWTSTAAQELRVTIGGVTKCLDAYNNQVTNGTKIELWSCNGGQNQKWTLNSNGTIVGVQSGKCLDVTGGGASPNGTAVELWTCKTTSNSNQVWTPTKAPSASPTPTSTSAPGPGPMAAAPYEYLGWGNPPDPTTVMSAAGVKWFTLAFVLSDGTCNPMWDENRPLTGGSDQTAINRIRAAGGNIIPSFGGWSGRKLGTYCTSASALAGAYQKVINAYGLKGIDIDIENTDEFQNNTVQQRIVDALKIIRANNSGLRIYLTMGTTTTGPDSWGQALIAKAKSGGFVPDAWVQMPFDFGGGTANMGTLTVNASEGLKSVLKSTYGWSDDTAYRHMGISSMNGVTDDSGELVRLADFQTMLSYVKQHHLARFTFWSVNRDRPCANGTVSDSCSGVSSQANWDYTKVITSYTGA
jgi:hypothetical protein